MMVRFSCFSPPVNRSKKVVQNSAGKLLADCQSVIEDRLVRLATGSEELKPIIDRNQNISPSFQMECWQSDDLNAKHTKARDAVSQTVCVKKSHSLGNMMEKESGFSVDDTTGSVDIDHGFSREYLNDWNTKEVRESFGNAISFDVNRHENDGNTYHKKHKENALIKSRDFFTDSIRNESLFSVEISKHSDHDKHDVIVEWTAVHIGISTCSSKKVPTLARSSCSVANLKVSAPESNEDALSHSHKFRRSRSFSDLNSFERLGSEFQNWGRNFNSAINVDKNIIVPPSYVKPSSDFGGKAPCHPSAKEETLYNDSDDEIRKLEAKDAELKQSYQPETSHYNWDYLTPEETLYNDSDDEIRKLEAKDAEIKQSYQPETSHYNWDHLTPEEFSMKRVEHWISQIDICDDFIVEEPEEGCTNVSREDPEIIAEPRKPDARNNHTMDVSQNRISSLSSSSSSVQMANVGLVTVPVLSPFVGLRVLNLSGNVIVRVTPGSLPKGLHMLNLSKNNISNIEGLRDLSHLRVLDLSYNRIAKIGHGLSSCTSLKELYLSGNKISDVEGLHRLAKLNIIDLRFNKISTANCLGQLAANYSSMQAINIEGNPVQINVGDEQLKKFLLSLLPNLVYYNKQTIRKGSKEVSGRGNFAAASPHFDRGTRAEHKLPRRGSISSGLYKSAINQGRQSPAEAMPKKETKDRHTNVLLPQPALKLTNRHLDADSGKKLRSDAMRRTQSTNALQKYFKS